MQETDQYPYAPQQQLLDASNLLIANFTRFRAFEDRTDSTYEHQPQRW